MKSTVPKSDGGPRGRESVWRRLGHRERPAHFARGMSDRLDVIWERLDAREQRHLAALWQNWTLVLGEDLADLAVPLGHKERTLHIAAEDNMAMQDLSMQSQEILERVNAFMDADFFARVHVSLMQGRSGLAINHGPAQRPESRPAPRRPAVPQRPRELGALVGKLDPESPVTRCYEAYVAMFDLH